MYEFVLYNLYFNCMNLFVWIRTKISEKNCIQVGISTRDQYRACNSRCVCHPHPHILRQWPFYLYTVQLRKPSENWDCTNSFVLHIVNPYACRAWPGGHIITWNCRHPTSSWCPTACPFSPSSHLATWQNTLHCVTALLFEVIALSNPFQH